MRLTPLDIRKQEFTRGFRGYEPEEVQAFLQMVSSQWDEILDDSRRKDERIRELENKMAHYEKVEEALQEALQSTRDTSRQALQNAEEKARLIVDEAERRADDIKRDAEQDRHQIKRETAKLSGRRSEIVTRLRAFLMSEMELLARYEGDDPVGFIKLLPAEEQRMRQAATESSSRGQIDEEPERIRERAADQSSASAPLMEDESTDEEARSTPTQRQQEEVRQGPGWTARTVISRPSEQTDSLTDETQESEGAPDYEEHEDEESNPKSSSDEIEKIRRILSDLD